MPRDANKTMRESTLKSTTRRSVHRTQWAAQYAVASELCKLGYQVAFTMGNHPNVDLMVISLGGKQFVVDVKGLYRENYWVIKPKKKLKNLFYVLAFVPDNKPNRFFVLTQADINDGVELDLDETRQKRLQSGKTIDKVGAMPGLRFKFAEQFENKWDKLPE